MNKNTIFKFVIFFVLVFGLSTSCHKEEEEVKPEVKIPLVVPDATAVNKFVYVGLRDYYLWNTLVPGLVDIKYTNKDSLNFFLNKFTDPQKLFSNLLYKPQEVDKWSFLVDNSKKIDDWISGTSKTMGYDFRLVQFANSENVFGYVRYVYKGSPAEKAGMKRGDYFMYVNDEQLTISNYQKLLFETENYKLGFINLVNNSVFPSARTVTMTAIEMQENPINKDTIFIHNNQKIGYLVYNAFNADFNIQLNDVFKKFKDAKIDNLVLDLRYNGGGSVQSSIYLASMIHSTDVNKVFSKAVYNKGLGDYFIGRYGANSLNDYFTNNIVKTEKFPAAVINTLNLQKIHIIVSKSSASASELLINGLRPYMKVTVVGTNTSGKYTGSMTVKDYDNNGVLNTTHSWAMQPIVVKYANSLGESDYINGLNPDITATESYQSVLPWGDPNERLLSAVLADIKGISVTGMTLKSAETYERKVVDSRDFKPFNNEMYINPIPEYNRKVK